MKRTAALRRCFYEFVLTVFLLSALGATTALGQDPQQHNQPFLGEGARSTQATQESTISSREAKELFRSVDEILQFASQDTGLPIKNEVKRKLTKRTEVQHYIQKSMKEDKDAKRLERSSAVLKKFGLIPRNFDLPKFLVTMLREQVAGYYDVKTKTVNLLNWVDVEQQKPVLAHELTHALQDQSFGIEKWMQGSKPDQDDKKESNPSPSDIENDEESSARQAVVEGQAMVVLLDYSLAPTGKTLLDSPQVVEALKQGMLVGTADSPAFSSAPIFLKEELTFPYRFGLDFTAALLQAGGKELAYAGAFKDPPKTTREIMEPQTYLAHEKLEPMKIIDMDKDFKDYDPFDIGAMGEFDVDILVEQYAGRDEATAIYPEWRGGYYYAGRPKGNKSAPIGLFYVSRWSNPARAAEFAAVYAKSLAQRYQKRQPLGPDGKVASDSPPAESWRTLRGSHAWMTEEGAVVIDVRGDTVVISESLDDATTKTAGEDYWSPVKPSGKSAPANP
ncbi:MAG TPA: hypothetical protein VK828_00985 [Terriglobales bacterium]|jgi:hypothetical protein|nr:hypothetical protein [Terriglobales bacterium]